MPRRKKPKVGRPSLGDRGRTKVVSVKLSEIEYAAIAKAVAKENAELGPEGIAKEGQTTVSSWLRDHGLDPLGLHPVASDD